MSRPWNSELPEEVRYLLDRMSGEELDLFRDRILSGSETADRVRDAENDLLDSYARGELPDDLRTAVERRLLGATDQQNRLQFAMAWNQLQSKRTRPRKPYYVYGAIAAAVLVALSVGLLWHRTPSQVNKLESQQLAVARITLPGIAVRSQATVPIFDSPTADIVELRVPWQPFLGTDLQATVADGSGRILWKGSARVDGTQTFVEVRMPRSAFTGAAFELALLKPDSGAALAYAYFRIRQPADRKATDR